jgi:xanthine dehydrogenase accessory factor
MPEFVEKIPEKSFVIIMTPGHEMDWQVLKNCLKKDFAYLGLMGSKSKISWLKEKIKTEGFPDDFINKFHCPIGLPIGTNHPSEIAISITSQILQERDKQIVL